MQREMGGYVPCELSRCRIQLSVFSCWRNIVKTKPDCVCREMKTGPWGDLLGKRALDRNGTRKVLGLLLWLSHIVLVCAADEAESISSLLMDSYSLHVYPQCAAQPASPAICTEGTNWEFLGRFHLHKSACLARSALSGK